MNRAFLLGAGLGTRLRPLTHHLPKPLVPLFHRPLVAWAMDACARAGIRHFAVNTHHLPQAWADFGAPPTTHRHCPPAANGQPAVARCWNGRDVTVYHEPDLLETGGGLKNIAAWIGDEPVLVHNADIFATFQLDRLVAAHRVSGLPVTLALRSTGEARHIALDKEMTRVTDIHGRLGVAQGSHVFTGIYCIEPQFLELLPAQQKVSVIPAFLSLAQQQRLGAIVLDDGLWLDLGDRAAYLLAHRQLALAPAIHPLATIAAGANVENSVVGPGAVIAAGAVVRDSIVWPDSQIASGACLDSCIICSGQPVTGHHQHEDL